MTPPITPSGSTVTTYQIKSGPTFGRVLRQTIGLFFLFGIFLATPCAFWSYTVMSVTLNQDTYKQAIDASALNASLLPGLAAGIADSQQIDVHTSPATPDTHPPDPHVANPTVQRNLQVISDQLSADDWNQISTLLLPSGWLQRQLNNNISAGFDWLNGMGDNLPQFHFDLTELKQSLSNKDNVQSAMAIIVPKMPACTGEQIQNDRNAKADKAADTMKNFLICNPELDKDQQFMIDTLTQLILTFSANIPPYIDFQEEFFKSVGTPAVQQRAITQFNIVRDQIIVAQRLILLLFLVPLGLFSIIIILTIRSAKAFFRWVGWGLMLSGIITLIPIPIVSGFASIANLKAAIIQSPGAQNPLFTSLFIGIATSISQRLSNTLLIVVAILFVVGFIALILSVLMPHPEPEITTQVVTVATPTG
jgi:hypothetical protein